MNEEALGVDIGGVLIDRVNDGTDTSFFSDNYLKTTAVPGAFDVLCQLVGRRFGPRVHLISKCGKRTESKTREWLEHHRFYSLVGVNRENLHFCRQRHEKHAICQRLGITHFIDDKLEVLGYLLTVPNRYLFQPNPEEVRKFSKILPLVHRVNSWDDIRAMLLP